MRTPRIGMEIPSWSGASVPTFCQLVSAQMVTADMTPDAPGIWLYHCHISDHMLAGMVGRYEVKPR